VVSSATELSGPEPVSSATERTEQGAPEGSEADPATDAMTMAEILKELPREEQWVLYRRHENYTLADARAALIDYRRKAQVA
jgi:hypothetical protein